MNSLRHVKRIKRRSTGWIIAVAAFSAMATASVPEQDAHATDASHRTELVQPDRSVRLVSAGPSKSIELDQDHSEDGRFNSESRYQGSPYRYFQRPQESDESSSGYYI